jgi:outer membrane protein assembly factor BamE
MRKLLIPLITIATLGGVGCAVHKIEIQQGNVVTQEMVDRLQPGMTKRQAAFVLGTPPVVDVFHQDRWDYVYTHRQGRSAMEQQHITLFFQGDELVRIEGDLRPDPEGATAPAAAQRVVTVPPDAGVRRQRGLFGWLADRLWGGRDAPSSSAPAADTRSAGSTPTDAL